MSVIYLDNNATTQVDPAVVEAMMPYFSEQYGNPSSIHRFGGMVSREVEKARASVAKLLNCKPSEIYFTGCGTESNNMGPLSNRLFQSITLRRFETTISVSHHVL